MDVIKIRDLEIYGHHGVMKEENVLGQKFLVSLALYTDTRAACAGFHCKAGSSGGYSKRWKTDADERASGIYRTACNCNLLQGVHPKMA